jgi:2-hydroxychromene-2-carboxylate isomerase
MTTSLTWLVSGLASDHFIADLAHDETERLHTQNIERALAAGVFGVPTFVTDAGEVFFGQDRLPVLRHHLWGVAD